MATGAGVDSSKTAWRRPTATISWPSSPSRGISLGKTLSAAIRLRGRPIRITCLSPFASGTKWPSSSAWQQCCWVVYGLDTSDVAKIFCALTLETIVTDDVHPRRATLRSHTQVMQYVPLALSSTELTSSRLTSCHSPLSSSIRFSMRPLRRIWFPRLSIHCTPSRYSGMYRPEKRIARRQ